jgi:hypothetical protein
MGPQGPIGPSVAVGEVIVTQGPAAPGTVGPQGPAGPKGDTGGWTQGTSLGTADLNTILTDGIYRQNSGSQATLALNYPQAGVLGVLYVSQSSTASWMTQRFHVNGSPNQAKAVYERVRAGDTWGPWRPYLSTRVDNTAGRAIYMHNDQNGIDQLVYGDTGWRTLTVPVVANNTVSGTVRIRRVGSNVYLRFIDVVLAAGTGYCPILTANDVPAGFKPNANERSIQAVGLGSNALAMQMISIFGEIAWSKTIDTTISSTRPATQLVGTVQWVTDDVWPTVLPGAAAGSIPTG